MRVPRSQRGGEVVEPLVRKQWFVRMKPLAEPALQVSPLAELHGQLCRAACARWGSGSATCAALQCCMHHVGVWQRCMHALEVPLASLGLLRALQVGCPCLQQDMLAPRICVLCSWRCGLGVACCTAQ